MTVASILAWLSERCVSIRLNGEKIVCRVDHGRVGDDILDLVRRHKRELVEYLNPSNDGMRTERLSLFGEPCGIESWERSGLKNLLAVAGRAGFSFDVDPSELPVCGPASATGLWRLIREQASGLSRLLREGD